MYANVIKRAFDTCTNLTISVAALAALNIFFIVPAVAIIRNALSN